MKCFFWGGGEWSGVTSWIDSQEARASQISTDNSTQLCTCVCGDILSGVVNSKEDYLLYRSTPYQ